MKLSIILTALLISLQAIGQVDASITSPDTELYVFSYSGLNLRAAPSTDAFIKAKLTHGTPVTILSESMEIDTIEHRIGRWILVEVNHKKGYLFDGFLSNHTPPSIDYSYQACEGVGYFTEWVQDYLNDSPITHEDYIVVNNEIHDLNCRELLSSTNSRGAKYEEITAADYKSVSFESDQITLNDVHNFMDYLAASANKYCGHTSSAHHPIIVPYRNKQGEIYKLRYSHPHTITAQLEGSQVIVEMKINI